MADRKVKMTDSFIRSLTSPEKRIEYYDKVVTGLVLRVTPNGHKSFALRYWYDGQAKQYTIGAYRDWSLADARKEAKELKQDISKGIDPFAEKQKRKNTVTPKSFNELAIEFKERHLPALREKTRKEYERIIDVELIPALGKIPAKELDRGQIVSLLDRKAIKEGKKTMANRIRARLHSIYEFGVDKGLVEHNPVSGTKPYKDGENESERFYSEAELCQIWQVVETMREPARSYLKILLLTGQRRTETQYMRWDHVRQVKDPDFTGWVWVIPAELSKSDRVHEVPLSPLAIKLLDSLRDRSPENPYVFASVQGTSRPFALKTIKRAVRTLRESSEVKDFRVHDLRRTVATYLAKLGTPAEVVSKVLNHKTGAGGSLVTRIYNRYEYRKERQTALNKWGHELQQIIDGQSETRIHQIA